MDFLEIFKGYKVSIKTLSLVEKKLLKSSKENPDNILDIKEGLKDVKRMKKQLRLDFLNTIRKLLYLSLFG